MAKLNFNDKPISFDDKYQIEEYDKIGICDYASSLADFIADCQTPITIGIQGQWGIGKTTLMNFSKVYLERKNRNIDTLWFNSWNYSIFNQDEHLAVAIINNILDALKNKYKEINHNYYEKGKEALNNLINALNVKLPGLEIDGSQLNKNNNIEDKLNYIDLSRIMYEFKTNFQNVVNDIKEDQKLDRIVIIIDDLDRVRPVKAFELLEALKNFLDIENCVFLIAIDYDVVQTGIYQKFGEKIQKSSGKSFFDKIIQLPFNMPTRNFDLKGYIMELLEKSNFLNTGSDEIRRNFYKEITALTIGNNPRSIKRVVNYAKLLDSVRKKNAQQEEKFTKEDKDILYALLCMQVSWPEIFEFFAKKPSPETIENLEDWEFLDSNVPRFEILKQRYSDEEQLKSDISSYFDMLFEHLDVDKNGEISENEFKKIRKVLKFTKLTSEHDFQKPIYNFFETKVYKNLHNNTQHEIIVNAFYESKWFNSQHLKFRVSGNRYVTVVYNKKQVGSIVSLIKEPILIRLNLKPDLINNQNEIRELLPKSDLAMPVRNNKTGIGRTFINNEKLYKLHKENLKKLFNVIHDIVLEEN